MVGGRGERLRAVSGGLPKPLVSVAGRPLLAWTLEGLQNRGFKHVTLCVGPSAEPFTKFLETSRGIALQQGMQITLLEEPEPLGTIGAWLLTNLDPNTPCYIQNGDVLTSLDPRAFIEEHLKNGANWTIAAHEAVLHTRFGELLTHADGTLLEYREKPVHRWSFSSGIYVVDANLQDLLHKHPQLARQPLPDLLQALAQRGKKVRVAKHQALWLDINDPDDLHIAERELSIELQQAVVGNAAGPDPGRATRFGERGWSF